MFSNTYFHPLQKKREELPKNGKSKMQQKLIKTLLCMCTSCGLKLLMVRFPLSWNLKKCCIQKIRTCRTCSIFVCVTFDEVAEDVVALHLKFKCPHCLRLHKIFLNGNGLLNICQMIWPISVSIVTFELVFLLIWNFI